MRTALVSLALLVPLAGCGASAEDRIKSAAEACDVPVYEVLDVPLEPEGKDADCMLDELGVSDTVQLRLRANGEDDNPVTETVDGINYTPTSHYLTGRHQVLIEAD